MYILAEVGILRAPGHAICSPPAKAWKVAPDKINPDQTSPHNFMTVA